MRSATQMYLIAPLACIVPAFVFTSIVFNDYAGVMMAVGVFFSIYWACGAVDMIVMEKNVFEYLSKGGVNRFGLRVILHAPIACGLIGLLLSLLLYGVILLFPGLKPFDEKYSRPFIFLFCASLSALTGLLSAVSLILRLRKQARSKTDPVRFNNDDTPPPANDDW